MYPKLLKTICVLACLATGLATVHAGSVELHGVPFPEKRPVRLTFKATPIAPAAQVYADVNYRRGQAHIDLYYEAMKPAILFGGDVTCFVVWAVTRDGHSI